MSLGIQRAWSCPYYKTVWNTLIPHTHNAVFSSRSFRQINCLQDYCWESWRWDGNYGKMFFKGRKKRKSTPLQLGLCCVVTVWERLHRWEVVIPLSSSSTLLQLCLLFIFSQKIFGFLQILRRVFPVFFFQPLPELQKLNIHIQYDKTITWDWRNNTPSCPTELSAFKNTSSLKKSSPNIACPSTTHRILRHRNTHLKSLRSLISPKNDTHPQQLGWLEKYRARNTY